MQKQNWNSGRLMVENKLQSCEPQKMVLLKSTLIQYWAVIISRNRYQWISGWFSGPITVILKKSNNHFWHVNMILKN
jgi:hypothetical protein